MPNVESCLDWVSQRRNAIDAKINRIDFGGLRKWRIDDSGNILHESHQFFAIKGLRVSGYSQEPSAWDQPIILQDEIGILGFIVKKLDGLLHFLVQAKIEPGNVNLVQLSPTLQATRSNFLRVHGGRSPNYLAYFREAGTNGICFDQFQSEQGARFLDKRNRNLIVEFDESNPVEPHDDYCWMTLGQLKALSRFDNLINMDTRSVLCGINLNKSKNSGLRDSIHSKDGFGAAILNSMDPDIYKEHSNKDLVAWITRSRFDNQFETQLIGLKRNIAIGKNTRIKSAVKNTISVSLPRKSPLVIAKLFPGLNR